MTDEYDLQSELDRKSGEALSWLQNERQRGAITEEAFQVALKTFDLVTLGLIDGDYSNWASETRSMGRLLHRYTDKTVLVEIGVTAPRILVIELKREDAEIMVTAFTAARLSKKLHTFEKHTDQVRAASERYMGMINDLLAKNFRVTA